MGFSPGGDLEAFASIRTKLAVGAVRKMLDNDLGEHLYLDNYDFIVLASERLLVGFRAADSEIGGGAVIGEKFLPFSRGTGAGCPRCRLDAREYDA